MLAPWLNHNGMGPDDARSSFVLRLLAASLVQDGCPVPEGGGRVVVEALVGIVRDAGGTVRTGADVDQVPVQGGRAVGVRLVDGVQVGARQGVLAGVTLQALYLRMLPPTCRCRAGCGSGRETTAADAATRRCTWRCPSRHDGSPTTTGSTGRRSCTSPRA